MNTTEITLAGKTYTLKPDNKAKFRFEKNGGRISALFSADHSYHHSITLLHALLDNAARKKYPDPEDLCDLVSPRSITIFEKTFEAANTAGWFPTAEALKQRIADAEAQLDQGEIATDGAS